MKITNKQIYNARKQIVEDSILPRLYEMGFRPTCLQCDSPYSADSQGCRFRVIRLENSLLELFDIYIFRSNKLIKRNLNIVILDPAPKSFEDLASLSYFDILPVLPQLGHLGDLDNRIYSLGFCWSERGFKKGISRLEKEFLEYINSIDSLICQFIKRWGISTSDWNGSYKIDINYS